MTSILKIVLMIHGPLAGGYTMQKHPRGEIKFDPSSFVVQELVLTRGCQSVVPLFKDSCLSGWNGVAPVTLFHLTKTGFSTEQAMEYIARTLQIRKGALSYYGLKDRHAVTSQHFGIEGAFQPKFRHSALHIHQVDICNHRLNIGGNAGNRFTIEVMTGAESIDTTSLDCVPNKFGVQRIASRQDGEVGRLLLEGNFSGAAKALHQRHSDFQRIAQIHAHTKNWEGAWKSPSMEFSFNFHVLKWRSWLWNELLKNERDEEPVPDRLPMWAPEHHWLYKEIWEPKNLNEEIAARMHRFDRATFVHPQNIKVERIRIGWRVCFDLPSGAYATTALSQLFELVEQPRN